MCVFAGIKPSLVCWPSIFFFFFFVIQNGNMASHLQSLFFGQDTGLLFSKQHGSGVDDEASIGASQLHFYKQTQLIEVAQLQRQLDLGRK